MNRFISSLLDDYKTESVDYHSKSKVFTELCQAIDQYRADGEADRTIGKKVTTILKKHFNVNVDFIVRRDVGGACIELPMIDRNSVFNYRQYEEYYSNDDLTEAFHMKEVLEATIDNQTGRVTGYFSELYSKIYMGTNFIRDTATLKARCSVEECAAIILHELGHLISLFQGLSILYQRNYQLDIHVNKFAKNPTKESRIKLISSLKSKKYIGEKIDEKTAMQGDNDKFITVVMSDAIKVCLEDMSSVLFNHTTSEMAADTFAIRHGGGKYLLSALARLAQPINVFYVIGSILLVTFRAMLWVYLAAHGALMAIFFLILTADSIFADAYMGYVEAHGHLSDRLRRIYTEMLGSLKQDGVPYEMKKQLVADIEEARKDLDRFLVWGEHQPFVMQWIFNTVVPFFRDNESRRNREMLLESLNNNELYLTAAKFDLAKERKKK